MAAAHIPASGAGGAVTADPSAKTSPEPGKAQPISASPNRPPVPDKADGRDDEVSKSSIAEQRAGKQRQ
jgi:hypothetical protein